MSWSCCYEALVCAGGGIGFDFSGFHYLDLYKTLPHRRKSQIKHSDKSQKRRVDRRKWSRRKTAKDKPGKVCMLTIHLSLSEMIKTEQIEFPFKFLQKKSLRLINLILQ